MLSFQHPELSAVDFALRKFFLELRSGFLGCLGSKLFCLKISSICLQLSKLLFHLLDTLSQAQRCQTAAPNLFQRSPGEPTPATVAAMFAADNAPGKPWDKACPASQSDRCCDLLLQLGGDGIGNPRENRLTQFLLHRPSTKIWRCNDLLLKRMMLRSPGRSCTVSMRGDHFIATCIGEASGCLWCRSHLTRLTLGTGGSAWCTLPV
mmetsp:Transcript_69699/g.110065  ORF Transcript_69699/g.110065 Transcript_69699/m.110065 type:complete len:207 (+) Transcript_69699:452-1072(+)